MPSINAFAGGWVHALDATFDDRLWPACRHGCQLQPMSSR